MRITTRFIKATDTMGERIGALDENGNRLIKGYDYALEAPQNHQAVAEELAGRPVKRFGEHARGYVFDTVDD